MSKPNGPFCWQHKETLRGIRISLDGCGRLQSVLSVYHALTEIASDSASDEFTTLQSHIGKLSGNLSPSTVKRCIKDLRELKVISYDLSRLRGPLKFKLIRDGSQEANDRSQKPNDGSLLNLSKVISSRRTLEESNEENTEGVVVEKPKRLKSPTQALPPIPTELDTPAFRTAWDEWIQYRRDTKRALTPATASKHLKDLTGWGVDAGIASIEASIGSSWMGLFEPKGYFPTNDQIVPSLPKSQEPENWVPVFEQLYPSGRVMPWDQLIQINPDVADEVRKVIADKQPDGTTNEQKAA